MTEADLTRRRAVTSVLGGGSSPMRLWYDESGVSGSGEPALTQAIANRLAAQFEAVEVDTNVFAAFLGGMDTQRAALTPLMHVATGYPGFVESVASPPGSNLWHSPERYVYSTETPTTVYDTWQTPSTGGAFLMAVWDPAWREYVISTLNQRVVSSGADAVAAVGFGREGATSFAVTSAL